MHPKICIPSFVSGNIFKNLYFIVIVAIFLLDLPILFSQEYPIPVNNDIASPNRSQLIYRNPRVYNIDYTFELCPDNDSIDPSQDLKLWIPVPREWDSQKAVRIISVEPEPQATYTDPEYGNRILFWDFGKGSAKDTYVVKMKYRAEVFEIYADIDPEKISAYDKKSEEYRLYTRSTHTIMINPELKELAKKAVGDEMNPYLQAKRIFEYVVKNMSFNNDIRRTRGSGVENILNSAVNDPETREKHFEGQCDHYSILFVALCRAIGIPARGVCGFIGWQPWIEEKDLKLRDPRHTLLTAEGLAAARIYGPSNGHIWAEFYLAGYGWIPADPTWKRFGQQSNYKFIITKGRDVKIGPFVTEMDNGVYGDQWIPLHDGRANAIGYGVWNITKIRIAKAIMLHISDPFPADAYAEYAKNLNLENDKEKKVENWRKEHLFLFYDSKKKSTGKEDIFEKDKRLYADRNAYLCQVLRDITGEEKFNQIFKSYLNLRLSAGQPISTERFQEIAEQVYGNPLDFFFKEWLGNTSLPKLSLDNVGAAKREKDWKVHGSLLQRGRIFHVPVELVLETERGQENQRIWLDSISTAFEFVSANKPEKITIDPDFHIPTVRWMPSHLGLWWNSYPELTVIYGTLEEAEANRKAAERLVNEFSGSGKEIIKPDTAVTESDLGKSLILFGRPEANKIAQRFCDSFPVKFEKGKFTWGNATYDKPSQGVALIIENPLDTRNTVNLYAGLSGDATLKVCDKSEWQEALDGQFLIDFNASFVIYENHQKLLSGDWEEVDTDLVWNFD
jgi:transglutaminase-like putative cysteine protease